MSKQLHEMIGDYLREIDKIKARERLTERKKAARIAVWRRKIRKISLQLQRAFYVD